MASGGCRRGGLCSTIVAKTTEPLRTVRDNLSDFVDRAQREHERFIVTRDGRPVAVLLSYDVLTAMEETLDVLSDPVALTEIRAAQDAAARGDAVEGVEAVRALRSEPPGHQPSA